MKRVSAASQSKKDGVSLTGWPPLTPRRRSDQLSHSWTFPSLRERGVAKGNLRSREQAAALQRSERARIASVSVRAAAVPRPCRACRADGRGRDPTRRARRVIGMYL